MKPFVLFMISIFTAHAWAGALTLEVCDILLTQTSGPVSNSTDVYINLFRALVKNKNALGATDLKAIAANKFPINPFRLTNPNLPVEQNYAFQAAFERLLKNQVRSPLDWRRIKGEIEQLTKELNSVKKDRDNAKEGTAAIFFPLALGVSQPWWGMQISHTIQNHLGEIYFISSRDESRQQIRDADGKRFETNYLIESEGKQELFKGDRILHSFHYIESRNGTLYLLAYSRDPRRVIANKHSIITLGSTIVEKFFETNTYKSIPGFEAVRWVPTLFLDESGQPNLMYVSRQYEQTRYFFEDKPEDYHSLPYQAVLKISNRGTPVALVAEGDHTIVRNVLSTVDLGQYSGLNTDVLIHETTKGQYYVFDRLADNGSKARLTRLYDGIQFDISHSDPSSDAIYNDYWSHGFIELRDGKMIMTYVRGTPEGQHLVLKELDSNKLGDVLIPNIYRRRHEVFQLKDGHIFVLIHDEKELEGLTVADPFSGKTFRIPLSGFSLEYLLQTRLTPDGRFEGIFFKLGGSNEVIQLYGPLSTPDRGVIE